MESALSDFNGLELFFLACAIVGSFFVVVKLIMQFLGGDADSGGDIAGDVDIDAQHADSDVGFTILSIHGFSSFFMMFGFVGLALYRQSQAGSAISIAGAVVAGAVSVWVIGKIFQGAAKMQSSGTLKTADAVGSTGKVYLTIPEGKTGKVTISFKGRHREFEATEKDGTMLPSGTPIRVVKVNANVLVVETLHQEKENS
ncbi:MAG: NfeD family protein [Thermodesulfobacteriota bacterium]